LSDATPDRITALTPEQLQALAIALLYFNAIEQLMQWLAD
jgi:hypothetical protein